jgi:hypothetical protein
LLRGEADPVGGVHGLDHVVSQLAQFGRDMIYALAFLAQDWVAALYDFQYHKCSIAAKRGNRKRG